MLLSSEASLSGEGEWVGLCRVDTHGGQEVSVPCSPAVVCTAMSVYPKHATHVSLQLYTQLCLQELLTWLSWLKVLAAKPGEPCSIPGTYVAAGEN